MSFGRAELELAEPSLALDWDNSTVKTMPNMRMHLDAQEEGGFPEELYKTEPPSESAPVRFRRLRVAYYLNSAHIPVLEPHDGVPLDLHIIANFFARKIDIVTARWVDAEPVVRQKAEEIGIANDIGRYHMRIEGMKDAESKTEAVKIHGLNYAIEDASKVAFLYAEEGVRVFLLDREWNRDIEESNYVMRCPDIPFIAKLLVKCGSPARVFEMHEDLLADKSRIKVIEEGRVFQEDMNPVLDNALLRNFQSSEPRF